MIKCRKNQSKLLTTANHKGKHHNEPMRNQSKNRSKLHEARENASDRVAIAFSFEIDWLRKWREFSGPII